MNNLVARVGMMVFGLLLVLSVAGAAAAATYSYTGNPFTSVSGAYNGSMRVTGSFTLGATLAPNLPMVELGPSVLSYSFSDGVQTLTEANSEIIVLVVSTDASGAIRQWRVAIWEAPITGVVGGLVRAITTSFNPDSSFVDDSGFTGGTCDTVVGGRCVSASGAPGDVGSLSSLNPADAGSWTASAPTESVVFTSSYVGNVFTSVSGAYNGSMRVTGSFTIAAPLAPNLPMTDVRSSVLGHSFFDGVQVLTDGNSELIILEISTNASGQIQEWRVAIWEAPVTGVNGGLVRAIDTVFSGGIVDDNGFTGGTCQNVIGGRCVSAVGGPGDGGSLSSSNPADAGTWNSALRPRIPVATHTYSGNPFTFVTGAYSTSMRVTGSLTLDRSLGPNRPLTSVSPFSVLNYSFSDGVQTLTDSDSEIIALEVSTDASGRIQEWRVAIWEAPVTGVNGGLVRAIDTVFNNGIVDDNGFTGGTCQDVVGGRCVSAVGGPGDEGSLSSSNPADAGTWDAVGVSREAVSAPALNEWGMIILAFCIMLAGGWNLRRRFA